MVTMKTNNTTKAFVRLVFCLLDKRCRLKVPLNITSGEGRGRGLRQRSPGPTVAYTFACDQYLESFQFRRATGDSIIS